MADVCAASQSTSKIGRLAHYNFAQCGVGGRWRARALHACMCARALEMPFSSTFSAAAGVTELLRGWDVAQRLARLALSNVAERGMGSRGHVGYPRPYFRLTRRHKVCTRAGMGTTLDALLHSCQVGRHRCHPACPRRFGAARMPSWYLVVAYRGNGGIHRGIYQPSVDMLVLPKPSEILGIFAPTISPCQPGRPWPSRLQRGWMRPAPGFARRPSPLSHRSLNLSRTTVTDLGLRT